MRKRLLWFALQKFWDRPKLVLYCPWRGEERPQHFEEEEVPTRRARWGKGKRRPHGLFEGLIAGPPRGCFTSSLDNIGTGSHLAPGFFKPAASSPASILGIVDKGKSRFHYCLVVRV